ncbi:MAG: glycosyltransferase family 2 protein [Candidatus Competibacteraceae bacterium]|nr:glycosyltransferase family 2 protein [Candidatus Competibacteraceae bacterium]
MTQTLPDISVIVPLYNEEESLPELVVWIERVMHEHNFSFEILLIDDGSNDTSWQVIRDLALKNNSIRGISFRRNYGKSAALNIGFENCRGRVIITMDADLQDSPDEIPALYDMITQQGFDLVSGWKKKRYDNAITKNLPSKLYNWATGKLSGVKLHDMNCGLKAYKSEVVKSIEVYGEMHRFIPVIAKWAGFKKIGEKPVKHQPRKYGKSKFGLERFVNGFLDLLSITFVSKFGKKPMHLFGLLGIIMFFVGFLFTLWMGAQKLWAQHHGIRLRLITEDPLFYIALVMVVLGTQLFLAGFLAEMISRNSSDRNLYRIKDQTEELS